MRIITTSIFLVILLFSFKTKATHIVGGELNYKHLGNNNYEIRLTLYKDCNLGNTDFDNPAALGVFDVNNKLVNSFLLPLRKFG